MKELFRKTIKGVSNEPSNEEIRFIITYLERQFSEIENTDLTVKTKLELKELYTTIISIESAIRDLLSPDGGNYHKLLKVLNTRFYFENRLSIIIDKLSIYISNKVKEEVRGRNRIVNLVHNPSYGYKEFELNNYIEKMELIQPLEDVEVESYLKQNPEQIKTLKYLSNYLNYLITKFSDDKSKSDNQFDSSPLVFFLRDTLLLYLGAKRLEAKGALIKPKAVLINRKLIHSFIPNKDINCIYKKSYNLIYELLDVYQGEFSNKFIEQYRELFISNRTKSEIDFFFFVKGYLEDVIGHQNDFIGVDTAAHGTMPLLTHVATGHLKSLEMFTSTPWLYKFYSSNIFAPNFPNMRTIESLVSQEELFQFTHISEGKIYINETCDSNILSNAKLEIGIFLNFVDKIHLNQTSNVG